MLTNTAKTLAVLSSCAILVAAGPVAKRQSATSAAASIATGAPTVISVPVVAGGMVSGGLPALNGTLYLPYTDASYTPGVNTTLVKLFSGAVTVTAPSTTVTATAVGLDVEILNSAEYIEVDYVSIVGSGQQVVQGVDCMVNGTVGVCSIAQAVIGSGAVQTAGGVATVTFSQSAATAVPISIAIPSASDASGVVSYFSSFGGQAGSGGPALTGAAPSSGIVPTATPTSSTS